MPLAIVQSLLVAADVRASVPSLVMQAGTFVKIVLGLLLIMSVVSWGIIWERVRLMRRVMRADLSFLHAFRSQRGLAEGRLLAAQHPHSVLGRLAIVGIEKLGLTGRGSVQIDQAGVELAQRAMQRTRVDELERLEKNLSFLATTGAVAPFLGLMGTVWGVMTAFLNIGIQGSASLLVVAPGIAEALIVTIAGLAAAIPAVIGYNYLTARVRSLDNVAMAFISEFGDGAMTEMRMVEEASPAPAPAEALHRGVGV
jgi:biopolymer transport protein TolQ